MVYSGGECEMSAAYLSLTTDELESRARALMEMTNPCVVCPRDCRVNRPAGQVGVCGIAAQPVVSSYGAHFGEERPLVGRFGSGTIFFTGCNLRCIFCQNYDISQLGQGEPITTDVLARMMISLQNRGCHNINLVTPTHQIAAIVDALAIAAPLGLTLPIVYNTGGYDSVDTLRLLDGIIDIYMPDAKFGDNESGKRLCGVSDYWDINREAIREMHRQVGDLQMTRTADGCEIATRGLLVRHLVLPDGLAGTREVVEFIATEISRDTYINVMDQYRPCFRASSIPEIARPLTHAEYAEALQLARAAGLHRFDVA